LSSPAPCMGKQRRSASTYTCGTSMYRCGKEIMCTHTWKEGVCPHLLKKMQRRGLLHNIKKGIPRTVPFFRNYFSMHLWVLYVGSQCQWQQQQQQQLTTCHIIVLEATMMASTPYRNNTPDKWLHLHNVHLNSYSTISF
jgi:hypothetical protein